MVYASAHRRYNFSSFAICLSKTDLYETGMRLFSNCFSSHTPFLCSFYAGYLRQHGDRFFPFLADGMDLDMTSYCAREVEPMGKECEQLHIIALTEYLGLKVSIEYLDGRLA